MHTKTCQHCGKDFEAKRSDAKFCGQKCRQNSHRNLKFNNGFKKCEQCGQEFKPKHGHEKYCSVACSENALRDASKKWKQNKRVKDIIKAFPSAQVYFDCTKIYQCVECGEYFEYHRGAHKYCESCSIKQLEIRHSRIYKPWADSVKARDSKCVVCGSTHKLEAHHIVPKLQNPSLARDLDNGISLCAKCHREGEGAIHKVLGHVYSPEAFAVWFESRKGSLSESLDQWF